MIERGKKRWEVVTRRTLIIYNKMPCNILRRDQMANVNCDQL